MRLNSDGTFIAYHGLTAVATRYKSNILFLHAECLDGKEMEKKISEALYYSPKKLLTNKNMFVMSITPLEEKASQTSKLHFQINLLRYKHTFLCPYNFPHLHFKSNIHLKNTTLFKIKNQ